MKTMRQGHSASGYALSNRKRFIEELKDFIRFPSISAQSQHAENVKQCAGWLANHLRQIGLERVKIIPIKQHPIVYAEWLGAPGLPTLLIYGHYDVQPVDPLTEWHFHPFEPMVYNNNIYGRGSSDNKGQLLAHIKAMESYLSTSGELPINVKYIFEGEEEIGSPNLSYFLNHSRSALSADAAVISDMSIPAPAQPAITYSLRGALNMELEIMGHEKDLHSGIFGGSVHNPLQALCEIIAKLHDAQGRIAIPGFYDDVRQWNKYERVYMRNTGPTNAQILRNAKAREGWGEPGYSLYERTTIRPAITVNSITGGYEGHGVKAVIPSKATAKLDFRLAPDQSPQKIEKLFQNFIKNISPPTVRYNIRTNFLADPVLINRNNSVIHAARIAYYKGFGKMPIFLRNGGTIPVVNLIQEIFGIPTVLMGFGLPDDGIHGPDEKFYLPNFFNGISTCIWLFTEMRNIRNMAGCVKQKVTSFA